MSLIQLMKLRQMGMTIIVYNQILFQNGSFWNSTSGHSSLGLILIQGCKLNLKFNYRPSILCSFPPLLSILALISHWTCSRLVRKVLNAWKIDVKLKKDIFFNTKDIFCLKKMHFLINKKGIFNKRRPFQ